MSAGVVLSVSQLNRYVKSIIEQDYNLQTVFVQGEISNFTNHYRTGHYYMTIKDEYSSIRAVMFKSANSRLRFMPENSMNVIIKGRVSVFERDGQYQLYIDDMQPDGAGALSLAFEQLKNKLAAEGLFDESRKRPIPASREGRRGHVAHGRGDKRYNQCHFKAFPRRRAYPLPRAGAGRERGGSDKGGDRAF